MCEDYKTNQLTSVVQTYKTEPRSKHYSSEMLVVGTQRAAGAVWCNDGTTPPPLGNGKTKLLKPCVSSANKEPLIHAFKKIGGSGQNSIKLDISVQTFAK